MSIQAPPTPTPTPISTIDVIGNFLTINIFIIFIFIAIIVLTIIGLIAVKQWRINRKSNMLISYKDFNTGKFKAKFYRKIANIYHEIGTEDIKIDGGDKGDKFKFKDVDFTNFDRNKPAFSDNDNKYYAFDFDTKSQMIFNEPDNPPKYKEIIELIDCWINKNVIRQLTEGLEQNSNSRSLILAIFVSLIIGLVSGVLIGYFAHTPTTITQETPKAFVEAIKNVIA